MAAPNTYYRGFIKQINSGDTVVIRGKPRGGPPQEQTIILSHITAPKLGRRPIGNDDATIDEPYAWESREFLRKLTVGQEVSYVVEYVIPKSDRKCCLVYMGNGVEGPCINEEMVKAGWAGVRSGQNKNSEEMGKYEGLLAEAVAAGLGIHNEEGREAAVRNVTWTHEDPRALFDEMKGKPVAGVVESVRDGSTIRLLLLPSMNYITLMLTGVRCAAIKPDGTTEEHAEEARYAVESRLLNRDVEIMLEGTSGNIGNARNQNFVGTVVKPGNISLFLLKEGLAKCVDWSMKLLPETETYRAAVKSAKVAKKRLWKNWEGHISSVPKDQKEFSGKVTEVVNGEVIIVKNGPISKRVTFSSIRQPRPAEGQDAGPPSKALYEVPYLFEAREFLRKRLIGKKVSVSVDYVKPANNGYPERQYASVFLGAQNIQEALVSKGLATVVMHRQDDDERAANYDVLNAAIDKAKKNRVGIHKGGEPPVHKVADLAGNPAKAKGFLPFLQRAERVMAVVEFVSSGSRARVYIPRETCLATILLSGISCPKAARPSIKGMPAVAAEPFGDEALEYIREHIMQREVEIEVEACDKAGNFIGYLFADDKNMSVELVKEGLASVHSSAERGKYYDQLGRAEAECRAARKKIWKDYVETIVEKDEGQDATDSNTTSPKEAAESEVVVTHMDNCSKLWVQRCSEGPALVSLMNQMRAELISNPPLAGSFTPKTNEICAAIFPVDNNWYRAKIVKVHRDTGLYDVLFIDYGNQANVSTVAPIAHQYSSPTGAAAECQLAFIVAPEDEEWAADSMRELGSLLNSKLVLKTVAKIAGVEQVSVSAGGTDLATHLLSNGLVEFEKQKNRTRFGTLMSKYEAAMTDARKNRRNRFRYGDFTSDDAKEFGYSK